MRSNMEVYELEQLKSFQIHWLLSQRGNIGAILGSVLVCFSPVKKGQLSFDDCVKECRGSIFSALQRMSNATVINKNVLNVYLNEITRTLLQFGLQLGNIKKIVSLEDIAAGHSKRRIIQICIGQAAFDQAQAF